MNRQERVCSRCDSLVLHRDRYCGSCGARLRRTPGPFVWLGIAGSVVLLGLLYYIIGDDPPNTSPASASRTTIASPTTTTQSTTQAAAVRTEIRPIRVECSDALPSRPCDFLIDREIDNAWNAPDQGSGAWVTFTFEGPVRLAELVIVNHKDEELFARNARVREIEVHLTGSDVEVAEEVGDGHGPFTVRIPPDVITALTVHVMSVYEAGHYGGREPFDELAVGEITLIGFGVPSE